MRRQTTLGLMAWLACAASTSCAHNDGRTAENPRPGQPGHRQHETFEGSTQDSDRLVVLRSFPPPQGFRGNLEYDPSSKRMWLISLGVPTNPAGSKLYEVDPQNGAVLAEAAMPFKGDFGDPVFVDGHLYQGVFHESKMYKIDVSRENFGTIVKTIALPTINDLKLVNEEHPYPFIEFGGVAVTPDKNIMLHADDVAELITIDRETGAIISRVRTLKAMGGIGATVAEDGNFFVLGNSDPRGGYCALEFPPASSRSPEQKDISWVVLDGKTGRAIASVRSQNSPAYASTVALVDYKKTQPDELGEFTFFATGEAGILEMQWTPRVDDY